MKISTPPNVPAYRAGTTYLLCWGEGHYVGFSSQVDFRIQQHIVGEGSVATKKAVKQGYELLVAQIWLDSTTAFESHIRDRYECPICGEVGSKAPLPRGLLPGTVMKSYYVGRCAHCNDFYKTGDEITYFGSKQATHFECTNAFIGRGA